ncbi:TolC family protein [Flavobacterium sp.]|uniref:TolC family protein n=1 Tax=Flavobacterium sp. TaxID=239 RepID=UPI00352900F1
MKIAINKKLAIIPILVIVLHSCGIPKITNQENSVKFPENFQTKVDDTISSASIKWKTFFNDPYLNKLIDSTLVNNRELNILLQKVSIAQNEIQARKGEYLPNLNLGVGADLDKVGEYTRNGAVEENLNIKEDKKFPDPLSNYTFGLYSTWEVDIWKKLRNSKKAAVMEYLASQEGMNFLKTSLVAEVASSYYELLALDNQLENLNSNITLQTNVLEIIKLLKDAARTTSLAVKRYEAEIQKNQSEVYLIQQEIVNVENRINFLMGRLPQKIERNATSFVANQPQFINQGLPSQLLQNRPDIRQASLELEAAKLNIKVAKANFYPSLGLRAGIGYEAFNPKFLITTPASLLYSIAGEAMMPLINRNAIKAEYKNASAKQIQAVFDYEQALLKAYSEVITQMNAVDNYQNSFDYKNKQVGTLNESVEIAKQLFQSARADYMEVLLTQRDVLEAKKDLIETKKNQFITMVNLYKALGGGWN